MKRFYFRGGELPFNYVTPERALNRNILGSNSGNLLYQYGILKAIMTSKEDKIECNWYNAFRFTPEYINENFDYFIIPLADAFRESFIDEMEDLTRFVNKLKIPCIVTGVGLRNPYEPDFKSREYKFNSSVKKFINAVLEKSTIVGVRGQITGDYLKYLGFIEDKHYMVIGCPSMFSNGCNLSIRNFKFDYNMNICINAVNTDSHTVNSFITDSTRKFKNWFFIGQLISELQLIYIGFPHESYGCNFPCESILSEVYQRKNVGFFLNAITWYRYMKNFDYTFGARLHGNIASIIGGTPSMLIVTDSRTRELAEYHKLYSCNENDLINNSIENLIMKSDYSKMLKQHKHNFDRFLKFLKLNNLPNIYQGDYNCKRGAIDDLLDESDLYPIVTPIDFSDLQSVNERFLKFSIELNEKIKRLKHIT